MLTLSGVSCAEGNEKKKTDESPIQKSVGNVLRMPDTKSNKPKHYGHKHQRTQAAFPD